MASGAAATRASQAAPAKALDLFPTPVQNQFADWTFESLAESADVGEIMAIANAMEGANDRASHGAPDRSPHRDS
jgi:hypothetical protein